MRALLLLLFMVGCTTTHTTEIQPVIIIEQEDELDESRNVWLVQHLPSGSMGSAFPISCTPGIAGYTVLYLTAGHVIEGAGESQFQLSNREQGDVFGIALERSRDHDLGVIMAFSNEPVATMRLDFRPPVWGERLFLVGYPLGQGPYLTEGRASGGNRVSTQAFPGCSGGPIMRPNGDVVGVIVGGYGANFQFITFAVIIEVLGEARGWVDSFLPNP